jgi:restriction endonuclease Mrr
MIYLQAKRWEGTVGRPEVQKFVRELQGQRAKNEFSLQQEDSQTIQVVFTLLNLFKY